MANNGSKNCGCLVSSSSSPTSSSLRSSLRSSRLLRSQSRSRWRFVSVSVSVSVFSLILCLNAFVLHAACTAAHELQPKVDLQQLERGNFLVGIANVGQRETATKCGQELEQLLLAVAERQFWAIKVLDSFGAPPKTFNWGNYFWFSAPELCDELNAPYGISFSPQHVPEIGFNVTSPLRLRFTVVYMNFTTPHFIDLKLPFASYIHVGLCLPASCAQAQLMRFADDYFRSGVFEMQQNFDLQLYSVAAKAPTFNWRILGQTGSVLFSFICIIFVGLAILAEVLYRSKMRLEQHQQQMLTKPITILPMITTTTTTTAATTTATKEEREMSARSLSWEWLLLESFRLSKNYEAVTRIDGEGERFLCAIAGLRTIVCLWVTVFHVYYYSLFAMSNAPLIFAKLEHFALQPILQACFYVDVFFVISAFLLVYNFLANAQQMRLIKRNTFRENARLWLKALAHRYLRLTPAMVVTMLLSDIVHNAVNMSTPFRLGAHSGIYCKRTWWYNLLYIHNLLDMDEICCSWTWYLACEMQYFVLFTTLLYVYAKFPKAAKILYATLSLGFVVTAWLCNYRNGITFQIDVIYSTLNQLYVKPWVRIIPYIGGAYIGWLLHMHHQHQHQHQQKQQQQQQQQQQQEQQKQQQRPQHRQQQQQHNSEQQQQDVVGYGAGRVTQLDGLSSTCRHRQCQNERDEGHHHHHHHRRRLLPIDAVWWRAAFWFMAASIYVATNFMSYWRTTPISMVAVIMSLGKLLFALCVGGVIALCATGYGGYLCDLLSARIFRQLNKFCFSIYMLAPVIVFATFGLRNEPTNFSEVGSGNDLFAITLLSLCSAFLLVLLVELPMQTVSQLLLRRRCRPSNAAANAVATGAGV